jgi:hypothetical protein
LECFNHPDKTSVGICRVCGKGVCHSCARTGVRGLVCSDECAKEEEKHAKIVDWSARQVGYGGQQSRLARTYSYLALIFLMIGIVILLPGLYAYFHGNKVTDLFSIALGLVMFVGAGLIYRSRDRG